MQPAFKAGESHLGHGLTKNLALHLGQGLNICKFLPLGLFPIHNDLAHEVMFWDWEDGTFHVAWSSPPHALNPGPRFEA